MIGITNQMTRGSVSLSQFCDKVELVDDQEIFRERETYRYRGLHSSIRLLINTIMMQIISHDEELMLKASVDGMAAMLCPLSFVKQTGRILDAWMFHEVFHGNLDDAHRRPNIRHVRSMASFTKA